MIVIWLSTVYLLSLAGIAVFGLLGFVTLWFYWRHRRDKFPCPEVSSDSLPLVTVQLPIYNERFVVRRLIDSAVRLDYPRDRLQIQVIDDSTDDTTQLVADLIESYTEEGIDVELHHRDNRSGYKAGALASALKTAKGDFIAVFDADFQPEPDFLLQTVPHFVGSPKLGMIQTRWGHLNAYSSSLTAAQSVALDKHFVMEQTVRHRANLFPKFNGSGGIWRKACLEDAGGWQADTVCEDLCLSTRAVLRGWRFRFLNDVVSPAELPTTVTAYKNQQSRWAKGSTQCLVKYAPAILADQRSTPVARLYALFSMAGYTTHVLLLLLLLVQVPLIYLGYRPPIFVLLFGLAGLAQPLLFVTGQQVLYPRWWLHLRYVPALLLVAIGLAPTNSRAILQAVAGRKHTFVRTPKGGASARRGSGSRRSEGLGYRLPGDWIIAAELLLAGYAAYGLFLSVKHGQYGPIFFMATCMLGFFYVGASSIRDLL